MQVFVTGASGFIGSAIVQELLRAGHKVTGLARSDESAQKLKDAGAAVHKGSLDDLDSLKKGAASADGVIHTAFIHDFSQYEAAAQKDKLAIEAMGSALAGTKKPFIVTAGTAGIKPSNSESITEDDEAPPSFPRASEAAALAFTTQGVRTAVIRLPPSVHDKNDHGFVPALIAIAREKGVSAYVGEGSNRWPTVHRLDAALLFRLVLEKGIAGSRYNCIADEGIPVRKIAAVIGKHLNLPVVSKTPEEAADHFGWMARFIVLNSPANSTRTKHELSWQPIHPGLIEDLNTGDYFDVK